MSNTTCTQVTHKQVGTYKGRCTACPVHATYALCIYLTLTSSRSHLCIYPYTHIHTEALEADDVDQTSSAILLSKLRELQKKIRDNREQVRARGKYLQSQPLTVLDSEASYLSEVLLDLRSLGADAQHLVQEVDALQFARDSGGYASCVCIQRRAPRLSGCYSRLY